MRHPTTIREKFILFAGAMILGLGLTVPDLLAQLQQSGGPGSTVSITGTLPAFTAIPAFKTDQTTHGTTDLVAADITKVGGSAISIGQQLAAASLPVILPAATITALTPPSSVGLNSGSAIVGFVRTLPAGCTQTTRYSGDTVGVATGAGTSVNSTTTCLGNVYVNNITNSPVTLRFQDKTGTPVIWVGGNADFSIPANSNIGFPFLAGVTMTSGITAIAGTAAALNLHVEGWQ